ncbi:MAG: hypothetical protein WC979_03020 [Candidatus Pacearchaeota archaeon]|jgi:DnaJ-class molecular chaperone|nr:hypothetical protein [Clostridia bacterium]
MEENIRIATVLVCSNCNGTGYSRPPHIYDNICYQCGGTGKTIGKSISIKELKELLNKVENE